MKNTSPLRGFSSDTPPESASRRSAVSPLGCFRPRATGPRWRSAIAPRLAAAGLLKDATATSHHTVLDELRRLSPTTTVVEDGGAPRTKGSEADLEAGRKPLTEAQRKRRELQLAVEELGHRAAPAADVKTGLELLFSERPRVFLVGQDPAEDSAESLLLELSREAPLTPVVVALTRRSASRALELLKARSEEHTSELQSH